MAGSWLALGATTTDEDGRAPGLLVPGTVSAVLRCRSEWSCSVCLRLTCTRQQLLSCCSYCIAVAPVQASIV